MKKFKYLGSVSTSATLQVVGEDKKMQSIPMILVPGNTYELPESNDYVKSLVKKGVLVLESAKVEATKEKK